MKTHFFYSFQIVIAFFLLTSCIGNNSYSDNEIIIIKQSQVISLKNIPKDDSLLLNIQQKVLKAFVDSKINHSDNALVLLESELLNLNKKNNNYIITYWYSYTCYYHSILFTTNNDKKNSEKILDEGIAKLNEVSSKSSEHHALLALMEGFSIQFASVIEMPFISKRSKNNAERALQLDSLNLRAYFVLGSNDFYTPEQYGGGKNAEIYLKKAISLKDQTVVNQYLPSWGKNSAYEMLIKLYIKRKQFDNATKCFKEAIALFPDDYMINKLASEIIKH